MIKKTARKFAAAAIVLACSGCATILDGTSQEIVVNTNPSGANCDLNRHGEHIGSVSNTPGKITVQKTKYEIQIVCHKPGYEDSTYLNNSGTAGATFGDIVLSGGIGWAVDSSTGSDNKYDSPVNITLNKK